MLVSCIQEEREQMGRNSLNDTQIIQQLGLIPQVRNKAFILLDRLFDILCFNSVLGRHLVVSNSLRPHGL